MNPKGPFALGFQFASDTVLENVTVKPMLTCGQESFGFESYHGQRITADEAELYGDAHAVGKNLIPLYAGETTVNGVTVKLNADGSVTLNGTVTATCYFNFPTMPLTPGTYTLSGRAVLPLRGTDDYTRRHGGEETPLLTVSGNVSSATGYIAALPRAWCRIIIDADTAVST